MTAMMYNEVWAAMEARGNMGSGGDTVTATKNINKDIKIYLNEIDELTSELTDVRRLNKFRTYDIYVE